MLKNRDRIDNLRIASPCPMNWDEMRGDDRTRFCEQCNLHVYNISELTGSQVRDLITEKEGRICARLYRRADGTVLTKDCPTGLKAIRRRVSRIAGATITAVLSFCFGVLGQSRSQEEQTCPTGAQVRVSRKHGQQESAYTSPLTGLVKDQNGVAVSGATVKIVNEQTKKYFVSITNDDGVFNFPTLESGSYKVEVVVAGFQPLNFDGLTLTTNETVGLDITIQFALQFINITVGILTDGESLGSGGSYGNTTTFSPQKIIRLPY